MRLRYFLMLILLPLGCGKEVDLRETTVFFNFKYEGSQKALTANPGRFVIFAHDEDRLEKARIIEAGSSVQMTLPNGNWKFSVLGFSGTTAGSPTWPFYYPSPQAGILYCGKTDYINLSGNPRSIQISVNRNTNSSFDNPCNSSSLSPTRNFKVNSITISGSSANYCVQWALPFGDRGDDVGDDKGGDAFVTSRTSSSGSAVIQLPQNSASIVLPYYLVLKIYNDNSGCNNLTGYQLQAEIQFDGNLSSSPTKCTDENIDGTESTKTIGIFTINPSDGSTTAINFACIF